MRVLCMHSSFTRAYGNWKSLAFVACTHDTDNCQLVNSCLTLWNAGWLWRYCRPQGTYLFVLFVSLSKFLFFFGHKCCSVSFNETKFSIYYYYLHSWIFTIDPGSFNNLISARFGIFYAYFCMPFYLIFLF